MIKHPTLYAKATNGKILQWWIEQDSDKYRTHSGYTDGQIVVSEFTVALPKNVGRANETTAEQQATSEILSEYKKKKKIKYKEDINDVDKKTFFAPMLAKKYNEYKDKLNFFDGTWIAQIKLNGSRCVITKDGAFTRTGEQYFTIPHILEELKPFFDQNPDTILDGELYNYEYRQKLNELISLVRKTKHITDEDLQKSRDIVQYHIYDMFDPTWPKMEYKDRHEFISNNFYKTNYCQIVPILWFANEERMSKIYTDLINDGQEGIMLRKINSVYEQKRSKNLLKLKNADDAEGIILEVHEGDGNWSGKAKTITVDWNGIIFDITFKGTMEEATQFLLDKDQWIGKQVTFTYFGLTGLGTPSYAQLDYNNCIPSH